MDKKEARRLGRLGRAGISSSLRKQWDERIFAEAKTLLLPFETIGIYISVRDEADTSAIIRWAEQNGKTVCVPRVSGRSLTFHRYSEDDLVLSSFGIPEPRTEESVPLSSIPVMIVPLLAFDENKNRIGYGRGYYDSVLSDIPLKVGIAYPVQYVKEISADPWDIPLDRVICPVWKEKD